MEIQQAKPWPQLRRRGRRSLSVSSTRALEPSFLPHWPSFPGSNACLFPRLERKAPAACFAGTPGALAARAFPSYSPGPFGRRPRLAASLPPAAFFMPRRHCRAKATRRRRLHGACEICHAGPANMYFSPFCVYACRTGERGGRINSRGCCSSSQAPPGNKRREREKRSPPPQYPTLHANASPPCKQTCCGW